MALTLYNKKRNFTQTPEPEGKTTKAADKLRFVVQRHRASHLHYDFRLEMGGTLKSWAVPKGPSLNPADKRLAMMVEDHPVSYINFEGVIPKGNYGAGTVEVWDKGTFQAVDAKGNAITEKQAQAALHKGEIKFELKGRKIKGGFALVKLKRGDADDNSWLLIKHRDDYATNEAYNSEDYSKNRKKEEKEEKQPAKKVKAATKEKALPRKPPARQALLAMANTTKLHKYIKPMLTTPVEKAFDGEDWLFELKLDGYRAIAEVKEKDIKLYSRNGLSFIDKYPTITQALQKIKENVVLDGEIVLLDENGRPHFQMLQHYEDNTGYPLVYFVFDILSMNGEDLSEFPLTERKKLLKKLLGRNSVIRYLDHIEQDGIAFFNKVKEQDMEGIIAKKKESTYHAGIRTKEWLKIKHTNTYEAVIAGYTQPRGSRKHMGALILGRYTGEGFEYMGHTGTGFNEQSLKDLYQTLQPMVTKQSPFKEKIKVNAPVTWVKPQLVAEIKYTELTREGIFRHPVFVQLRPDKKAEETGLKGQKPLSTKEAIEPHNQQDMETEQDTKDKTITVQKHKLQLTNLDKVYWPDDGYTKQDLIDYYDAVADYILPYLKNRPMSLKRNPNGITDEGFYQKDAAEAAPDWVNSADVFSESNNKIIHYIVCDNKATLLYLANLGCIEMNPWNSTTKKLDYPSYMVIDIDPSEKNTFEQVIETANVAHDILKSCGAAAYCKTSGATGLHVYVPMGAKYTYDQVKEFGHIIASLVQEQLPDFTTLERSLSKRGKGNIYVDYLQNRTGQTLAAAYSVRPRKGASVSAPLDWKEVKTGLSPQDFTIQNIIQRIQKKGDLFAPVLGKGINLNACLKKLGA